MTIHPDPTFRPAVTPAEQRFLDLYAAVCGKLPGTRSAAVRAWRDRAVDAFTMLGVPHRRVEEWKYTDLRTLMQEVRPLGGLSPKAADVSVEAAIGKSLAHLDAYRAVFVGGRYSVVAIYGGNDEAAHKFQAETGIPIFKWDVGDYDACAAGLKQVETQLGPSPLS